MDRRQNDGAAGMDSDVHFVSDFNAGKIHQRGIEDDALGISDFRDRLSHDVILCFTSEICQRPDIPTLRSRRIS